MIAAVMSHDSCGTTPVHNPLKGNSMPKRVLTASCPALDFKQAYDSIPRCAIWEHLQRNCMPTCLLNIIQNLYDADEYVLVDGTKQARVRPTRGVKQGCPLSPLLFSLYINDVDCIVRDVRGAVTGIADVCVTHMLYADDLSLTANEPGHCR